MEETERLKTWWCRLWECPNHEPRTALGLPPGWLRVQLGVRHGKSHWMTFCSAGCLRRLLEVRPQEFAFDPKIERRRIERARQRKQRRAGVGASEREPARPAAPAAAEAVPLAPAAPTATVAAPAAATVPPPAPSALVPPTACPRCGAPKLVRAFATVWSCEACGAQVKRELPKA